MSLSGHWNQMRNILRTAHFQNHYGALKKSIILILTQLTSFSFKFLKVFDVSGFMALDSGIFLTLSTYSEANKTCTLMIKFGKEFRNLEPSTWKDKTATKCAKPRK